MIKKRFFTCLLSLFLFTSCTKQAISPTLADDETQASTTATSHTTAVTTIPAKGINTPPADLSLTVPETLEANEQITVGEVISHSDIILQNSDEYVNTTELGETQINVKYLYKDKLYEYPIDCTVTDTTAPVLLNSGDGAEIEVGTSFDLNDYVGFVDNYDRTPELTYSGSIDSYTCGTYYLTATVADSSGNETSWDLSLTVTDKITPYEDNSERVPFEDFVSQYAEDGVTFGIDVSRWQGDIDFEAVKNAGCEFVIMRIGSYYDEYTLDSCFTQNMAGAVEAGLDVGVYLYTTANTEEEIRENAQWVTDQLDGQQLDFPIVFDWEEFSNFQQYEMNINDLNEYFENFSEELEKENYSAMLYSSKNFLNNFWYEHSDYPIWLAHYTDYTDYDGEYAMWQASCYGNIDGIEGDVDMNILYNDKNTWN